MLIKQIGGGRVSELKVSKIFVSSRCCMLILGGLRIQEIFENEVSGDLNLGHFQ